MSRGRTSRVGTCDAQDARVRLDHARQILEVAELVATDDDLRNSTNVAVSLAVLAGIAARDAAC